jgi:hypothetical protein
LDGYAIISSYIVLKASKGFDSYDLILYTYVAPIAIADLLGVDGSSKEGKSEIAFWTSLITCVTLLGKEFLHSLTDLSGWAFGGIIFGKVTDL